MNIFERIAGAFSRKGPADQEELEAAHQGDLIRDDMATWRVGQRWMTGQSTQPDHQGTPIRSRQQD
jgi:hypothetical protein